MLCRNSFDLWPQTGDVEWGKGVGSFVKIYSMVVKIVLLFYELKLLYSHNVLTHFDADWGCEHLGRGTDRGGVAYESY